LACPFQLQVLFSAGVNIVIAQQMGRGVWNSGRDQNAELHHSCGPPVAITKWVNPRNVEVRQYSLDDCIDNLHVFIRRLERVPVQPFTEPGQQIPVVSSEDEIEKLIPAIRDAD